MDKRIIKKLKKRDEQAFDVVYHTYVKLVYHVIFHIVQNKLDSEDITQEVFIKMFRAVETLKDESQFKYWLLSIAKNHALNFVRQKKLVLNEDIVLKQTATEETVSENDFDQMMKRVSKVLNQEEFDIITLHIYHQMTFKEIGMLHGQTTSAVNNKYARGIQKIKKYYKEGGVFL